jgi:hypothetical protein
MWRSLALRMALSVQNRKFVITLRLQGNALFQLQFGTSQWISNEKRGRIHEYLSFRAAVKTDAGTAAAAHTDESKVRFARHPGAIGDMSQ